MDAFHSSVLTLADVAGINSCQHANAGPLGTDKVETAAAPSRAARAVDFREEESPCPTLEIADLRKRMIASAELDEVVGPGETAVEATVTMTVQGLYQESEIQIVQTVWDQDQVMCFSRVYCIKV